MKWLDKTAIILAAIGAINWGLVVLNFNLVELITFGQTWLADVIYVIVALSGVWALVKVFMK